MTVRSRGAAALRRAALLAGVAAWVSVATAQEPPVEEPKPGPAPAAPPTPTPPTPGPTGPNPPDPRNAGPGGGIRVGREQMWPAPTAEDWKKPVLLTFQRTWDDAQAVSKETGKAILICVNMDGEIASEHYAGVRYREPAIAPLYEPYVCVIASVYRHTPRDHDDDGRRIVCPRFGSVTCGEHIAIEPILYEKFFDGRRIAPRHVMVELDGSETYDIYYRNDTASVFEDIRGGIAKRANQPPPVVRGDRPIAERVASRDVEDRRAVEKAYAEGDAATRRKLLEASLALGGAAPVDVLRQAVFGLDPELSRLARRSLAQTESVAATDLLAETLRLPLEPAERDALVAALARLGKTSRKAEWLAVVHQGLGGKPGEVDVATWSKTLDTATAAAPVADAYALEAERTAKAEQRRANPQDGAAALELAEVSLTLAARAPKGDGSDPKAEQAFSRLRYEDARRAGLQAEELGAKGWRADTVVAVASYYLGDAETAYARAESAVKGMPPGESGWSAMAALTIYAESRWKAIKAAIREQRRWPAQWLTDVNAAYSVLRRHPEGTAEQVVWHYDFLDWLGVGHQAARVLDEGIARFRESSALHERFRKRTLERKGAAGLEAAYASMLESQTPTPSLEWFASYASVEAGEFRKRSGEADAARASFDRAVAGFQRVVAADPSLRVSASHRLALVLGSRARLAYEAGDDDAALADVLASFAASPGSAGDWDGLGVSPVETAQMLLSRLRAAGKTEPAQRVADALAALDPDLLRPDRGR